MKLEINGNNISYKNNISQKDWQKKLVSKINEIESLIKNNDLEEKQKTLEIQKNNAYFKLEKIGKELQNMENFLEENDYQDIDNIEDEESLNKKIYDIRQKNISLQEQLKMITGYSNFVNKYKINQNKEKNKLNNDCDNLKKNIHDNKYISRMTEEEKIILEKNKELKNINQDINTLLKKIEEKKAQRYIRNIRLKQLKSLSNNKDNTKKKKMNKNKTQSKKKQNITKNNKNNKNNIQIGEILDNIIQNNNQSFDKKANNEKKNESTFNIINRKMPFTISSIDNLINDNNILLLNDKEEVNQISNYTKKNSVITKKQKVSDIIKLEKENISKMIASSENKNKIIQNNNNNNINTNNNKNNISIKNDNININKNLQNKEENKNKNEFNIDNPLGWLENDNNKKETNINNNNIFTNDIMNNYNFNNNINDNKEESKKIDNNEENKKEENINNNNFNNKNSDISEVKGLFGRRRPFAAIKF